MAVDLREAQAKKTTGTVAPTITPTAQPGQIQQTEKPKTPDDTYPDTISGNPDHMNAIRKELYEEGIEDKLFFKVLDSVITEGNFTWEFNLLGKVPCAFQIRPDWIRRVVVDNIEEKAPKTIARFTDILNRYNLAGSLIRFGDAKLTVEKQEDLDEALAYLGTLPFVTINLLIGELSKFDKIITVAMSPWALENFIEPRSEK